MSELKEHQTEAPEFNFTSGDFEITMTPSDYGFEFELITDGHRHDPLEFGRQLLSHPDSRQILGILGEHMQTVVKEALDQGREIYPLVLQKELDGKTAELCEGALVEQE